MHQLVIASTNIRRDAAGRYSLNDLHRAAGGLEGHRPSKWLDNKSAQELAKVAETKAGIRALAVQQGGVSPGTYAVEQLVVAYAAWISAEFHFEVINTFLASKQSNVRVLPSYVEDGCTLIESATRTLLLAPSATLGMYQRLGAKTGHQDILPAYAVDASNGGGSSEETKCLRDLLRIHRISVKPQDAYKVLEVCGIVERKYRASTKGARKGFWCVTKSGLAYGKNLSHPESPRQTQPHFYVDKFVELVGVFSSERSAA